MCRWHAYLALIDLEIMTFRYNNNAILEYRALEIPNTKNILCGGITKHLTTTGTTVTIIQNFLSLLESKTPVENGINSDAVECISDNTIRL